MANKDNIREQMEILGSDGKHVGVVDRLDGGGRIKLTRSDANSGGVHHFISMDWVDHVDQHVHLNKTSTEAMAYWQTN